jgi:hypothetical protein
LHGGKAFKRKTKIAEESANRGCANWRQFTQGIPVVDAIQKPVIVLLHTIMLYDAIQ